MGIPTTYYAAVVVAARAEAVDDADGRRRSCAPSSARSSRASTSRTARARPHADRVRGLRLHVDHVRAKLKYGATSTTRTGPWSGATWRPRRSGRRGRARPPAPPPPLHLSARSHAHTSTGQDSRTTSDGDLSGRRPRHTGCRSRSSCVHSPNATCRRARARRHRPRATRRGSSRRT